MKFVLEMFLKKYFYFFDFTNLYSCAFMSNLCHHLFTKSVLFKMYCDTYFICTLFLYFSCLKKYMLYCLFEYIYFYDTVQIKAKSAKLLFCKF